MIKHNFISEVEVKPDTVKLLYLKLDDKIVTDKKSDEAEYVYETSDYSPYEDLKGDGTILAILIIIGLFSIK